MFGILKITGSGVIIEFLDFKIWSQTKTTLASFERVCIY